MKQKLLEKYPIDNVNTLINNLKKYLDPTITIDDISTYKINKFDVVHMDCDLHISTIDAYKFLLDNQLIDENTIIISIYIIHIKIS